MEYTTTGTYLTCCEVEQLVNESLLRGINKISLDSDDDPFKSKLSNITDVLLSSYMVFIALFSLLLNVLVLITMKKRYKSLTTPELYICNLALLDLTHTLFAHPQVIIAGYNHRWYLGPTACTVYAVGVFFFGTTIISSLAVMSVMRYIKVCHSGFDFHVSKKVALLTLIPVYINGAIWCICPLLGWGHYGAEPYGISCSIDWFRLDLSYTLCMFSFVFVLPLFIMIFCYTKIVMSVSQARKNVVMRPSGIQKYITKICILMCACFMLSWTPYAIVALLYSFKPSASIPLFISVSAPYVAKSSSCYNPLVYFLSIPRFRKEAKDTLYTLGMFLRKSANRHDTDGTAMKQINAIEKEETSNIFLNEDILFSNKSNTFVSSKINTDNDTVALLQNGDQEPHVEDLYKEWKNRAYNSIELVNEQCSNKNKTKLFRSMSDGYHYKNKVSSYYMHRVSENAYTILNNYLLDDSSDEFECNSKDNNDHALKQEHKVNCSSYNTQNQMAMYSNTFNHDNGDDFDCDENPEHLHCIDKSFPINNGLSKAKSYSLDFRYIPD